MLEEVLTGGNVAGRVVRVGSTVRKPAGPFTDAVDALLRYLTDVGCPGVPRSFDRDDEGRQVLEYVPGTMADQRDLTPAELVRVGRLIREMHDALAGFVPPADVVWQVILPAPGAAEQVCHYDLAPWNLVLDEDRWVFIDWDSAGPGRRMWDLGYAAHGFVPLAPDGSPSADAVRFRSLVDGYGADDAQRKSLPGLTGGVTRAMADLLSRSAVTGEQPWARLHDEGHGRYWQAAADYVEHHGPTWTAALLD
ncbi:MAG TPA: phosphotransferase [Pseudonocardiaceae bacterium]